MADSARVRQQYNNIQPHCLAVAWNAEQLRNDDSWIVRLDDSDRAELFSALEFFKEVTHRNGLTAQWLHGNLTPGPKTFPLPALASRLQQCQADLEDKYGIILLKGFPVADLAHKDLQLLYAGMASHIGTPRPQTMFGEMIQDIRDYGQSPWKERRGSKHNRPLDFHTDPCDVTGLLCIHPAQSGGEGLFVSSMAMHNALLASSPEHVETLYQDFTNTYQDYLFIKTGFNQDHLPRQTVYSMPTFSVAHGRFACKYSRFYIDQAQEDGRVPKLTAAQSAALDALQNEMQNERWQLPIVYEPGDLVLSNNFTCFHARTAFNDTNDIGAPRRHLMRIWLSVPNSRPLSPRFKHYFFQDTEAGASRGGLPLPAIEY